MVFSLPTILENAPGTMGGVALPDTSGTEFTLRVWQLTGITAAQYFRTLKAFYTGAVLKAAWSYSRMGGAGSGYFKIQGGVEDMDLAVQNEWEIDIVRGAGAFTTTDIWYRARIVRYTHGVDEFGNRTTEIWTEGYASKLAEIYFSATIAAGQTIKQAIQTILTTYVTPNTRIRYDASDIEGSYALVTALNIDNQSVLSQIHKLAMLQGSTEWGVTEGGTAVTDAPAFYFKAQSSSTSESAVFILQAPSDVEEMKVDGSFEEAFNRITVLGGYVSGAIITATGNDATAQSTYGLRPLRMNWSALQGSTDAQRFADNYIAYLKDGNGSYTAVKSNPTERLEPDRTLSAYGSGSTAIPTSPKAQWWGDTSKVTELWNTIDYTYEQGCPFVFKARCSGGFPRPDMSARIAAIYDRLDDISGMLETPVHSGSGTANTIPKWTSSTALGNSSVTDDGTKVTFALPLRTANGTAAAPAVSGTNQPTYGIFFTSYATEVSINGISRIAFDASGSYYQMVIHPDTRLSWSPGGLWGNNVDLQVYRQTASVIGFGTVAAHHNQISSVAGIATVFNETGADIDFRCEGDTDANLLFVDASTDSIQLGGTAPTAFLHLKASTTAAASLRVPAGTAPTSPNEGDVWQDSTQKALITFASGVKQTLVGELFTQTADQAIANTGTETTLFGNGTGTLTLPANFYVVGKTTKVTLSGYFSTMGTGPGTIQIKSKLGSTIITDTGTVTPATNITNASFILVVFITCRTTGATGTVQGNSGGFAYSVAGTPSIVDLVRTTGRATVTIDTTASQALSVTFQWGTADAGNTITVTGAKVDVEN